MSGVPRERTAWLVVTAVLATSLAWTAVACVALLAGTGVHCPPEAIAVARALARAAVAAARVGAPAALATGLTAGVLAALLLRESTRAPKGARHE